MRVFWFVVQMGFLDLGWLVFSSSGLGCCYLHLSCLASVFLQDSTNNIGVLLLILFSAQG